MLSGGLEVPSSNLGAPTVQVKNVHMRGQCAYAGSTEVRGNWAGSEYSELMQLPVLVFDHMTQTVVAVPTGAPRDLFASQRSQVATSGRPKK